jgi:hypothetical protein
VKKGGFVHLESESTNKDTANEDVVALEDGAVDGVDELVAHNRGQYPLNQFPGAVFLFSFYLPTWRNALS